MEEQLADTDTAIFIITFHFFYSIIPKLNLILKKKKEEIKTTKNKFNLILINLILK